MDGTFQNLSVLGLGKSTSFIIIYNINEIKSGSELDNSFMIPRRKCW